MRFVLKIFLLSLLPFAAAAQFLPGAQPVVQPRQPVTIEIDGYAAKVNDRVITRGEVREAMGPAIAELHRQYQDQPARLEEELKKAFDQARVRIIENVLIMAAFEERGGAIPDQYVEDEVKRVISQQFKGDEALFEQLLAEQKKTRAEYMKTIREQMAVGMMMNEEVSRRARVTPERIREEYDQNKENYFIPEKVKFGVIVLNKGATPEDLAVKREEAEKIRARLLEGADFAETAKEVSEGSRAADGGAFPWMQPKDAREELRETLRSLPSGEISEIIETDSQLYLVKVEARRQPGYKNFDEVREEIKTILTAKERDRLRTRWIERLRKANYIVIYE